MATGNTTRKILQVTLIVWVCKLCLIQHSLVMVWPHHSLSLFIALQKRKYLRTTPLLTVGSIQDIYSRVKSFISFIRGNNLLNDASVISEDINYVQSSQQNNKENTLLPSVKLSEELLQTEKYQHCVYHPFICEIREIWYIFHGPDDEWPDELTAVSWFDGCVSQLRPLLTESNLQKEKQMKIIYCKHSVTWTTVKKPAEGTNLVDHYLEKNINYVLPTAQPTNSTQFINLPPHTKN